MQGNIPLQTYNTIKSILLILNFIIMKKIFMLITCCFMAIAVNAAELNIYASGLKSGDVNSEKKVEIEYFLNAPATALAVNIMQGETIVKTIDLTDAALLTQGAHTTTLDLSEVSDGTYSWTMTATGATTESAPVQVNDTEQPQFQFYHPRDVIVDNSYESPYFGRIYATMCWTSGSDGTTPHVQTQTKGIFILDPGLTDITNQGNQGYSGGITWPVEGQGPKRIMVDAEGGVWVCDNGKDVSGIYIMDPANPSADFKPVFADGTRDEEGVKTVDGTAIHGKIAAFCLTGSGEDTKLYTMDNSLAVNGATLNILQYNVGSLDAPYALPYDAIAYDNSTGKYANSNLAIVSDKTQGGFWVAQNRWGFDAHPAFSHISSTGDMDFSSTAENFPAFSKNVSYRGAVAVNNDGSLLAAGSDGTVKFFDVSYDAEGVPALQFKSEWVIPTIGNNIDGIAFDVADNLYVVSASSERMHIFALPKATNTITVPAPSTYKLEITPTGLNTNLLDAATVSVENNMLQVHAGQTTLTGYAIYSFDGRMLKSLKVNTQQLNVPIDNLAVGTYLIRLTSDDGVVTKKFIKR